MNHEKCQLELPRKEKLLNSALEDNANALTTLDPLHTTHYCRNYFFLLIQLIIECRITTENTIYPIRKNKLSRQQERYVYLWSREKWLESRRDRGFPCQRHPPGFTAPQDVRSQHWIRQTPKANAVALGRETLKTKYCLLLSTTMNCSDIARVLAQLQLLALQWLTDSRLLEL